ncbi:acyltransferase family protein [Pseudescherichia sp.]|uniref:acyltransferase family protein n=1 Tax=Pseudescherichia sp. TaxID=2055881 RepID=UPI00289FAE5D|nr:acyltransferase family protein [Pseudescherichia sp.]
MSATYQKQNERIYWVDALRFIAMFLVYIGHLGSAAGRIYGFVYLFHVPLFFFISGLFYKEGAKIVATIKISFTKLIVPYFYYSILSLGVYALFLQKDVSTLPALLTQLVEAKRNFIEYAPQLWFLPCLFFVIVFFSIIQRFVKNKVFIMVAVTTSMALTIFIPQNPVSYSPGLPYGLDSALYYIFWFALGFCIKGNFITYFNHNGVAQKTITTLCGAFALLCFFGLHHHYANALTEVIGGKAYVLVWTLPTLILFVACIPLAKQLANINAVRYLGSNTLFLCGYEAIAKTSFVAFIGIAGHSLNIGDEYYTVVYISVLMFILYKVKSSIDLNKSKY